MAQLSDGNDHRVLALSLAVSKANHEIDTPESVVKRAESYAAFLKESADGN